MTPSTSQRISTASKQPLALVAIVLLAMLVRLPFVIATVKQPGFTWSWGGEMLSIAHAIVSGEGFSSPYGAVTGPTAQQMPVYPYLVAFLARVEGGSMEAAARAALGLNLIWSGLTALVLVALADRLRPGAGLATGWMWALVPIIGFSDVTYLWDTSLFTFVMAALFSSFFVLIPRVEELRSQRRALVPFVLWGLFAGGSFLINPAHLLVVCAALLLTLVAGRITFTQTAVVLASIGLVVSPWIVRNSLALGRLTGLRSNLGYEVYRGLMTSPWQPGAAAPMNPGRNRDEMARYASAGESRYMANEGRRAIDLVMHSPQRVMRRVVSRSIAFWWGSPEVERNAWPAGALGKHLLFALPAFAGVLGLVFLLRRRPQTKMDPAVLGVVAIIFVIMPLPYYVTLTMPRYRAPLEPWFVLLAVCAGYEFLKVGVRAPATASIAVPNAASPGAARRLTTS
jgi:hypothetical protein